MGGIFEKRRRLQQLVDAAIAGEATHFLILTGEAEYHLVNANCVAVRRRGTGLWMNDHRAVDARLLGGATPGGDEQPPKPGAVRVGEVMCFDRHGDESRSDTVLNVEVPPVETTSAVMQTISRLLHGFEPHPAPTPVSLSGRRAIGAMPIPFMVAFVSLLRDITG